MTSMKKFFLAVFLAGTIPGTALMAADKDKVDPKDFVEEASAKGLAEIETGQLALQKSQSPEVREFAQSMIEDHKKANQELAALAQKKNLKIAKDAELMNQAKALVLKQRDGESFDEAYANNQVAAHKQTLSLLQKAANSDDAEIKAFAQKTLPKLQHHLQKAVNLQAAVGAKDREAVSQNRDLNDEVPESNIGTDTEERARERSLSDSADDQ